MHDIRRFGHGGDHIVSEGCRMRRRETHTLQALDLAAGAQQLGKGETIADAVAEGVHILPEQRDFLGTFIDALANLGEDVARTSIMFLATRGRHDAERARVIAPHGDGHPARYPRGTIGGQLAREIIQFLLHLDLRMPLDTGLVEQLWQRADVLRTEHGIDPWGLLGDPLTIELRHASTDGDLQVRAFALHLGP